MMQLHIREDDLQIVMDIPLEQFVTIDLIIFLNLRFMWFISLDPRFIISILWLELRNNKNIKMKEQAQIHTIHTNEHNI
jgi:hypothetical protein